jgi:hypothetical protein
MNAQCNNQILQSVRIASLGRKADDPKDAFRTECDRTPATFSTERHIPDGMQSNIDKIFNIYFK